MCKVLKQQPCQRPDKHIGERDAMSNRTGHRKCKTEKSPDKNPRRSHIALANQLHFWKRSQLDEYSSSDANKNQPATKIDKKRRHEIHPLG